MKNKYLIILFILAFALNSFAQNRLNTYCKLLLDNTFTPIENSEYLYFEEGGTTEGDDKGTSAINLDFDFELFGKKYNKIHININGNITFDNIYGTFNATGLSAAKRTMLAPYWVDIDLAFPNENITGCTTGCGKIWYKKFPNYVVIVWDNVGSYANLYTRTNTFQLILTDGNASILPNGNNVSFYYDKMNWATTGSTGESGNAATVGIVNVNTQNGVSNSDFVQIGRFSKINNTFNGFDREDNGVKWLESNCTNLIFNLTNEFTANPKTCNLNKYNLELFRITSNLNQTNGKLKFTVDNKPVQFTYNNVLYDEISVSSINNNLPKQFYVNGLNADGNNHIVKCLYTYGDERSSNGLKTDFLEQIYKSPSPCLIPTSETCSNCTPSFSPIPGEKYLLSGWVKKKYTTNAPDTYTNVGINLTYKLNSGETTTIGDNIVIPSGPIIDGWQKIEQEFTIPKEAAVIVLELVNDEANMDAFFDDIRIHPFKSNMKSFVYNPSTQKLVAELDENNYATKYEYDDEGILIRVKKETERGVMTIKETRNNQSKLNKQ